MSHDFCKEEKCVICSENEVAYKYVLIDNSSIDICKECGEILYNKEIVPYCPDRLFHIIALMQYVRDYKNYIKYMENKNEDVKTLVR
jgi:transcription initiation factor TFIIIB Brf1 subunit/transcription initiation factor TFIIB